MTDAGMRFVADCPIDDTFSFFQIILFILIEEVLRMDDSRFTLDGSQARCFFWGISIYKLLALLAAESLLAAPCSTHSTRSLMETVARSETKNLKTTMKYRRQGILS